MPFIQIHSRYCNDLDPNLQYLPGVSPAPAKDHIGHFYIKKFSFRRGMIWDEHVFPPPKVATLIDLNV